jgi:hypothetical protein
MLDQALPTNRFCRTTIIQLHSHPHAGQRGSAGIHGGEQVVQLGGQRELQPAQHHAEGRAQHRRRQGGDDRLRLGAGGDGWRPTRLAHTVGPYGWEDPALLAPRSSILPHLSGRRLLYEAAGRLDDGRPLIHLPAPYPPQAPLLLLHGPRLFHGPRFVSTLLRMSGPCLAP